jgi:hypothetical protein
MEEPVWQAFAEMPAYLLIPTDAHCIAEMKRVLQSQTAKDLQTGHRTNKSVMP